MLLTTTNRDLKAYLKKIDKNEITPEALPACARCALEAHYFKLHGYRERHFLIIDEAHLTNPQTLTDLRLLISSFEDEISLKILFCGQENAKDILKCSSHADLVHRMPHRIALHTLTKKQTGTYINSRITQAGGANKTFEPEAKDLIHDYTGEIPRQINNSDRKTY